MNEIRQATDATGDRTGPADAGTPGTAAAAPRPDAVPTVASWPRWVALIGLFALAGLVFGGTLSDLARRWSVGQGYAHGWLMLGVVAWILATRGRAWAAASGAPAPWAPVVVLAGSLAWLASVATGIQAGEQLAAWLVLCALPLAVFGPPGGLRMAGAVGLMIFALPVWDLLLPLLQGMTVAVTGACLRATGVPNLIEGNLVTIPAGRFQIVAGCSGLNYFVAACALAAIWAFLWLTRWSHRLLLLGTAAILAMVANWLRVYTVILAGQLTEMQHFLVTVDHYWFGWVLFGLAMIPVFWLGARLEAREAGAPPDQAGRAMAIPGRVRLVAVPVLAAAALLAGPVAWTAADRTPDPARLAGIRLPPVAGWTLETDSEPGWRPRYSGAEIERSGLYVRNGERVEAWLLYYPAQVQGRELVFFGNRLADPGEWVRLDGGVSPMGYRWLEVAPRNLPGPERLIRAWYEVGGRLATEDLQAKALQLPALLEGRRDAALVALSAPCDPDCEAAASTLDALMTGIRRPLTGSDAGTRSDRL